MAKQPFAHLLDPYWPVPPSLHPDDKELDENGLPCTCTGCRPDLWPLAAALAKERKPPPEPA